MLYGLLVTLLVFVCLLLILVILIQQGKGGIGLGSSFGGAQMLFGGSGGQDIFQKITWTLGAIFMLGSLGLFFLGSKKADYSSYLSKKNFAKTEMPAPVSPAQAPIAPAALPASSLPSKDVPSSDVATKSEQKSEAPATQNSGATKDNI